MVETIEIFLEQQLMANKKTAWETLTDNEVKVEVDKHRQTKGNLDYLSWAWAWGALKDKFPSATFQKHFFDLDGAMVPYTRDSHGFAYVKVTVSVEGLDITEILPVLNNNKPVVDPDSFQVNTALQRCMTKAIGYHGLGFHIYAGEDLEDYTPQDKPEPERPAPPKPKAKSVVEQAKENPVVKAVEEELGATLETVSETDGYENVYDGDANLIHGFDDVDTLKFVFPGDCSLTDQEAYVNKHFQAILKTLDLESLQKFTTENVVLFKSIANSHSAELKKHIHITQISQRKADLSKENN